jgi:hypothetical protein
VYIDPRTDQPFYIGKGKGNRLFTHLEDQVDSDKTMRISEIRVAGMEPKIDILRYGLSDSEAALVEATAIDLIGKQNLTNRVAGYHSRTFGRITSKEIIIILTAKPVKVRHKAILININQLYRSNMTSEELYEATRGVWRVGKGTRKNRAELAIAVYQGIVREVYRIDKWWPAATLQYKTRDVSEYRNSGRWEFDGVVAEDIRNEYVGFAVGPSGQNPIKYVNI